MVKLHQASLIYQYLLVTVAKPKPKNETEMELITWLQKRGIPHSLHTQRHVEIWTS